MGTVITALVVAISWVVGCELGDRVHRALFKKCNCHFCMAWRLDNGLPMYLLDGGDPE